VENLILPRRSDTITQWQAGGGAVAAVFPIHYPRSLLRAFNLLPVEVWGPPGVEADHGASHLQPTICSVVRNALSFLLSGGLDAVDLLVVPHACDSLQGFASILIDLITLRQPVIPIYLPRGRRQSDLVFLADELRSVFRQLETLTGRVPSDAELREHIYCEEAADELLAQVSRHRSLGDAARYRLIRAREYLPAERFVALAREALAGPPAEESDSSVPLLLSGILPEPMALLDAITTLGGRVVADDLACCGRRHYAPGESEEPFQRMAERILHALPDPTRGSPLCERLDHLLGLVAGSGARGVVFYEPKFCEVELFDLPTLRQGLEEAGVPSMTVEVDLNDSLSQRVITRLEAFLEMLG
jgi:benzoyl-CoA reductase/2-hydroxyglutaryl-CoA dehydratase subunit BcrC/BadD/HgdB